MRGWRVVAVSGQAPQNVFVQAAARPAGAALNAFSHLNKSSPGSNPDCQFYYCVFAPLRHIHTAHTHKRIIENEAYV